MLLSKGYITGSIISGYGQFGAYKLTELKRIKEQYWHFKIILQRVKTKELKKCGPYASDLIKNNVTMVIKKTTKNKCW